MNKVQVLKEVSKLWNLELFYAIGVNRTDVTLQGEICRESMQQLTDSKLNISICSGNGFIEAIDSESIKGWTIKITLTFD